MKTKEEIKQILEDAHEIQILAKSKKLFYLSALEANNKNSELLEAYKLYSNILNELEDGDGEDINDLDSDTAILNYEAQKKIQITTILIFTGMIKKKDLKPNDDFSELVDLIYCQYLASRSKSLFKVTMQFMKRH